MNAVIVASALCAFASLALLLNSRRDDAEGQQPLRIPARSPDDKRRSALLARLTGMSW